MRLRNMFVDRDEMKLLEATFDALRSGSPLPIPIALFWGIAGIGKTTLLQHIAGQCQDSTCVIWVEVAGSHEIRLREQGGFYHVALSRSGNITSALIKVLLEQHPVVLLVDGVDTPLIPWIEMLLREVIRHPRLFVAITSRKSFVFEQERDVAKRLHRFQVQPFTQWQSEAYLEQIRPTFSQEERQAIIAWAGGYPLALQVAA